MWDLGITGEGALVATLDTGVDGNHPALASRWRGLNPLYAANPEWAWFDPVTNTTFPQSFGSSHGTHTMGSVCGGMPGDQVGVAPGATPVRSLSLPPARAKMVTIEATPEGMQQLLPALRGAKTLARRVSCQSNIRQLAIAWDMYLTANDERFYQGNRANHDFGGWCAVTTVHG